MRRSNYLWLFLGIAISTNTLCVNAETTGSLYHDAQLTYNDCLDPAFQYGPPNGAVAYFKKAQEGDVEAQLILGDAYSRLDHRDLPLNYQQARKWYERAANQQSSVAVMRLGQMNDSGLAFLKDPVQAFELYKKAGAAGLAEAQYLAGRDYLLGHGVAQDHKSAIEWLTNSAKQGYAPAQCMLASLYLDDYGPGSQSAKYPVVAYAWLACAAGSNQPESQYALAKRELLRHQMSVSQILEAEKMAMNPEAQIPIPAWP